MKTGRMFSVSAVTLALCALACAPIAVTSVHAQSKSLDAQFVRMKYPSKVDAGDKVNITVEMKNTGRNAWTKDFYLGSSSIDNGVFSFPRVRPTKKINPGATATFKVTGRAPSNDPGTYTVQWRMYDSSRNKFGKATKSYDIRVRGTSSSSSSSSSAGGYGPTDLAMSMSGPSTAEQNSIIRYTVTVRNNGPYAVNSVFPVQMAVIPALTFRADQSSGGCYLQGQIAKCDVSSLAVGESRSVTMAYYVNGTCNSQVQIQSFVGDIPQGETNWVNNASPDVLTTVSCTPQQADLSIQGTVQGSSAIPQTFSYTLTVKNAGPIAVQNAEVRLSIPDNFSLVTYTSNASCQKQGGIVTCSGMSIPANVTQSITVVLQLPTTGYACNAALSTVATVTSSLPDPNAFNNTSNTMTANVYCAPVTTTPNLFSAKDITPIRTRQLLGGQLGEAVLRVNFRAQNDSVEVTHLQLTGISANTTTPTNNALRSVDRFDLFKPGEIEPFASATTAACAAQTVPANTMCADMAAGKFIVSTTADQVLIVRPVMKTDTDGGISGDQFTIGIGTQANAIRAKSVASGVFLNANDGNGTAAGEVFVGTATPAANVAMVSNKNTVVMAKIASIVNANQDAAGTHLPVSNTGNQFYQVSAFKISAAQHANALNGLNKVQLSQLIFTVNSANVSVNGGSFRLYNKADTSTTKTCTAINANGDALTGTITGNYYVNCTALNGGSMNTQIEQNSEQTFVLDVIVLQNPVTAGTDPSFQVSLENFTDAAYTTCTPQTCHILWNDIDALKTTPQMWIDYAETVVRSTKYN